MGNTVKSSVRQQRRPVHHRQLGPSPRGPAVPGAPIHAYQAPRTGVLPLSQACSSVVQVASPWHLQKQGGSLPRRPCLLKECPDASQPAVEPFSEWGQVVAGVQDVGDSALLLSLPQLVRVGREGRPPTLPACLQRQAAHGQHHPHSQQDEV